MSGLLDIGLVRISRRQVLEAHAHLRDMGLQRFEGFALWVGERMGKTFQVRNTIVPGQRAMRSENGVCVVICPEELHRMNVWLFQNRLTIIAQLHSHPTHAYHSEMDDTYPVATTVGCLSFVLPNFAAGAFSLETCAVYRLMTDGTWAELPTREVLKLVQITD